MGKGARRREVAGEWDDARRGGTRLKAPVAAPRATRVVVALGVSVLLTTALLYVLYTWAVPLGETGKFVYRYSKMLNWRLSRCWPLVPIVGVLCAAMWLLARPRKELMGVAVGAVGMAGLAVWTWWLPPMFMQQHAMNLLSPSHEGAFLIEAMMEVKPGRPGEYLRRFDKERLTRSVEEMRGTRVVSNTPGTTVLAYWVIRAWPPDLQDPGVIERYLLDQDTRALDVPTVAMGIKFSIVLAGLWGLSAACAYGLGRVFFSPLGAGLFAVLVTYNPATANFVPGKDPAQLLTINAMLWAWFWGVKRRSAWGTGIAGTLLTLGMCWGLVHLWVAMAAWVVTAVVEGRKGGTWGRRVGLVVAAPTAGVMLFCAAVYLLSGWNVAATLVAVTRRYEEVQRESINYDRRLWFVIGLPLFLLFVSPVVYALIAMRRRGAWRWGRSRVLWVTAGVMVLSYFVGVTYELSRLWVAFVPMIVLGAMEGWPAFRAPGARRVLGLVVALLVVNCVTTAMHVAALDARESEFRLTGGAGPGIFQ